MKAVKETWALFISYSLILARNPYWVLSALFQPVCFLYLFAPLLDSIAGPMGMGNASSINVFTPGILVMVSLFGAMYVGFSMVEYWRAGVLERLRVTTASRLSILMGMVLRDVVTLLIQTVIVILLALPLGLSITPAGALITIALMAMIAFFMAPLSYALALTVRSEDALGPIINLLSQPILLLSGILLPLTLAPVWLQNVSNFNPVKYVVDAARAIFNGNIGDPAVWQAFAILAGAIVLSFWWSLRRMKKSMG